MKNSILPKCSRVCSPYKIYRQYKLRCLTYIIYAHIADVEYQLRVSTVVFSSDSPAVELGHSAIPPGPLPERLQCVHGRVFVCAP